MPDSLADDIANRPTNQSVDYFGYGSRGYLPAFMQALKTAVFAALLLLSSPALAVGDRLIEAIMRSDFVFDKTISNVPFFPLGFLSFKYNDSLTLQEGCSSNLSCDLSYHRISQGFGLPVWVGQRDMIILAETLDSDKLEHAGKEVVLNDVGVLAAWISQPATEWQLGAFTYFFEGINSDDSVKGSGGAVLGGIGRYRHQPHFHSYWGMVRISENSDTVIYPYIGFDWFIGKEISIAALLPWPTVSYSPDTDTIYRFGATFSDTSWVVDANDEIVSNSLSTVDLGLAYEKRIASFLWAEAGIGYSGFGRITVTSDSQIELESNLEPSPYLRFSVNIRPE
ncbi:MAG: hypothetical protein GY784_06520 [Gammaproteobacteria bacterium]|nr:hypothetical protein [Gammaproteobacteria bacterium]